MASSFPISLRTISVAETDGPFSVPNGLTSWSLVLNRNVGASPINTLLDNNMQVFTMLVQFSLDGGTTWLDNVSGGVPGGQIIPTRGPNTGVEQTTSSISSDIPAGTGRQGRVHIVPNATFTVSGQLNVA